MQDEHEVINPATEETIATVPARFAELGDLHADIDDHPYALDTLLEWAERDERTGKAPAEPTD